MEERERMIDSRVIATESDITLGKREATRVTRWAAVISHSGFDVEVLALEQSEKR